MVARPGGSRRGRKNPQKIAVIMFRIRRVYDDVTPTNKEAIAQVQNILREQFPALSKREIARLPKQLRNPLKYRFRSILFIAEGPGRRIGGFALLLHEPILKFCYLDFLSTARHRTGGGIGSALYERVRTEALNLNAIGLFFECLPDDPRLSRNPEIRKQNVERLRFFERHGALPVVNTAYETPLEPGEDNPPYLLLDDLGQGAQLRADTAREIVRAILERKYADLCPPGYIDTVVESFRDDPVQLRKPRYSKKPAVPAARHIPADQRIVLLVNDRHAIHHVQEKGYVEAPVRIDSILAEIDGTGLFQRFAPRRFSDKHIKSVHDSKFVNYLTKVCAKLEPHESVYPYVFPIRNAARPPAMLPVRAGYYCIDTFTPLTRNAYPAAKRAVYCALTAAEKILEGYRLSYALIRPPGHHAERRAFGGFCYLNSAAVAAEYLSKYGKIAMVDIDYHHGNGQQNIFYERSDVLTISIHGHPRFAYPYFSGFKNEKGFGAGKNYNMNMPLPENVDGKQYRRALENALKRVKGFRPDFLVIALGLDTARSDPTGTWSLEAEDFEANGRMLGSLNLPTLAIQEGGYDSRLLGINARHFFTGLWSGAFT
jgi:acetoin utilization deacetylase AcuC-like enzyme/GNAT superfamily N-acetyltransferase